LRSDDHETISLLYQRTRLGTVTLRRWKGTEVATWNIYSRGDALALVEILDLYPLRSKKRMDYLIWRDAVARPTDDPQLPHLASQLSQSRAFEASVPSAFGRIRRSTSELSLSHALDSHDASPCPIVK
jgi:hypothetical protein